MHPSATRVAYLWLTAAPRVPTDIRNIERAQARGEEQWDKDKKELAKFKDRAEREFLALVRSRSLGALAVQVAKDWPAKNRPYQWSKLLRTDGKVQGFAGTFTGIKREGAVRGMLVSIRFPKKAKRDPKKKIDPNKPPLKPTEKAVASIRNAADSWFRETRMVEAQAPLTKVLPVELMRFLPPNIHVEVDAKGTITHMTDRFEAERESLAKKIAVQKALVKRYNAIAKMVKADLKSSDEMVKLAALITSILMETGIRPGALGNSAPMKGPDGGFLKGEDGKKVYAETFGAITLGPSHVRFIRTGFAELEFVGKMSTVNFATMSDANVLKMLSQYVATAKKGGSKFIFVTKDGRRFEKKDLASYFNKRLGKWLRPTDFRKLRSTEEELDRLIALQKVLYADIRQLVEDEVDDLQQRVVEEIVKTLEDAITDAAVALSHENLSTTIKKYLNPEVILKFLATGGDIERTLGEVILSGKPTLAFDTETFIAQATKAAGSGLSLQDVLDELETDLEMGGVSV